MVDRNGYASLRYARHRRRAKRQNASLTNQDIHDGREFNEMTERMQMQKWRDEVYLFSSVQEVGMIGFSFSLAGAEHKNLRELMDFVRRMQPRFLYAVLLCSLDGQGVCHTSCFHVSLYSSEIFHDSRYRMSKLTSISAPREDAWTQYSSTLPFG